MGDLSKVYQCQTPNCGYMYNPEKGDRKGKIEKGTYGICDMCGKKSARIRPVTRSFGRGRNSFMIENIPVVTCASCGESYLTAETLREIERIKLHRHQLAVEQPVAVAQYGRRG